MNIENRENRVLITGGAGFIGSHITEYLLSIGWYVKVIDNLSTGKKSNIDSIEGIKTKYIDKFEFIYGDISNLETCRKAVKDVNMICHQAALGSVPRSVEDPLMSHISNVNGQLNILIAAKEVGIKRIVYASSSSVYGDNNDLPKMEKNVGNPLSPYAVTKKINELYGNVFSKVYDMECIGLRYFNVFGPKQDPNGMYAAVIPKFISNIKSNITPSIYGDGNYSRDFTYIANIVKANYLALTTKNKNCFGNVFNIGNGGRVSINELYYIISTKLGFYNKPNYIDIRTGDIPHSNASIDLAYKELGYIPRIGFRDGITLTLEYYNKN
jgi:UDP-N-acetylglucosamine 4-epimerase